MNMAHLHFETAEEFAAHQSDREVAQALRVQMMTDKERSDWLSAEWDPLQKSAAVFYGLANNTPSIARHFATIEEKNAFDREREVEFALQLSFQRG